MISAIKLYKAASYGFKKWPNNPRIYVLILSLYAFVQMWTSPFLEFSREVSTAITPWIFPYLTCNSTFLMILMLGVVLLFCDAPFTDSTQYYVLVRCGKSNWIISRFIYILMASFIYIAIAEVFAVVSISSNLQFSLSWGKVFGTLAQTDANLGLYVPYKIQLFYSPAKAILRSFFLAWMVSSFIGLMMLMLSLAFSRAVGSTVAVIVVFSELFVQELPYGATYFSPVSWASLAIVDTANSSVHPSMSYILFSLTISMIIFSIISTTAFRRRDIDALLSL